MKINFNDDLGWIRNLTMITNRFFAIAENFRRIITFVFVKQLLESVQPLVTYLQGKVFEVDFRFKKVEKIIIFGETRE